MIFTSCYKKYENNCSDFIENCRGIEPHQEMLIIKVSPKPYKVIFWLYKGQFNDTSILLYYDTVRYREYSILLELNSYYYAKAKYVEKGKIVYAIDGVFFKKELIEDCDTACWQIKNNVIDVTLKSVP
ncbi:MAG: hypothetical protein N3A01_08970 [Bacteroidales bacterium]|nr:hypothetical protein [Bacteroidales bacterium]